MPFGRVARRGRALNGYKLDRKEQAVSMLLSAGADVSVRNRKGVTALEVAQAGRRREAEAIAAIIESFGGKGTD